MTGWPTVWIADGAGALQGRVEQTAAHHPGALDPLDVPVDRGVEGQQVAGVEADAVTGQLDEEDEPGLGGEEHVALAGHPHERDVLAGDDLLEQLADAAGLLVVEPDVALVGHHRALDREHVAAEVHAQHLRVLQGEALLRLDLEVGLVEQWTLHAASLGRGGSVGRR